MMGINQAPDLRQVFMGRRIACFGRAMELLVRTVTTAIVVGLFYTNNQKRITNN